MKKIRLLHLKATKRSNEPILLLSSNEYTQYSSNEFTLYYMLQEHVLISKLINQYKSKNDIKQLIKKIQHAISSGIFILVTSSEVFMGQAIFNNTFSWIRSEKKLIISDSDSNIALFLKLPISLPTVALNLINIPYYPFYQQPLWEGINKIRWSCILQRDEVDYLQELEIYQLPKLTTDIDVIYKKIRERLVSVINLYVRKYREISADISGGVDSATIVYILKSLKSDINIYRAESDSEWNSDSRWANLIINDINDYFTAFRSIGETGRKFDVNSKYANGVLPSSPVIWSDTEGYVESIYNSISNQSNAVHLTGLGGDELFTPMPAYAWSVLQQNKMRVLEIGLKYSMMNRIPLRIGFRDLLNKSSFEDSLKDAISSGFGFHKFNTRENNLNWFENINIPDWLMAEYRDLAYQATIKSAESVTSLDLDRSRHQMLESIMFQNHIINQLNHIYRGGGMTWKAPFLDSELVNLALAIPAKYRDSRSINKPILYESMKGIVPREIFMRNAKGDYSSSLYKSFKRSIPILQKQVPDFILVKLGLVDKNRIISNLSMPTSLHSRIESFERLVAVERWVRVATKQKQQAGSIIIEEVEPTPL